MLACIGLEMLYDITYHYQTRNEMRRMLVVLGPSPPRPTQPRPQIVFVFCFDGLGLCIYIVRGLALVMILAQLGLDQLGLHIIMSQAQHASLFQNQAQHVGLGLVTVSRPNSNTTVNMMIRQDQAYYYSPLLNIAEVKRITLAAKKSCLP